MKQVLRILSSTSPIYSHEIDEMIREKRLGAPGDRKTTHDTLCLMSISMNPKAAHHVRSLSGQRTEGEAPHWSSLQSQMSSRYQMGDKYPIIGSFITSEHVCFE